LQKPICLGRFQLQGLQIRLDSKYAFAYMNRGNDYKSKNDRDKAIADYTEAVRLKPNDFRPYFNRGITYSEMGEKAKADADLTQSKKLQPTVP
jgi:tetratricopeptide (TPR) repeat protein